MSNPPHLTEDALIEKPAIELFKTLRWQTLSCFDEFELPGGSPLGRDNKSEIILTKYLYPALERLNPTASADAISQAIEILTQDRGLMSMVQANREVYHLLKDGIAVQIRNKKTGEEVTDRIRIIDWNNPDNNDFLLVSQFWVSGEMYTRRPDLVGFVNGIPLVLIELKASHKRLENAYNDNLRDYKDTIPHIFNYNAIIILSNGSQSLIGGVTSEWEHFADWKKINSEGEEGVVSLETMLRGACDRGRLLDIVENYTLFCEAEKGYAKILGKNHQYLGVKNVMAALEKLDANRGKLGVFWHTQGSGKSFAMIFFAQKILRKIPGNWTFVIVTDRQDLGAQIYKNFARAGAVTEKRVEAENGGHLKALLTENHRYVFTLIQKFHAGRGNKYPELSKRRDIIVITDEAHRTQYDVFAANMRSALPNAAFIGFTGTPLMAGEEKTRDVFGDYVSIYNFKQSVDDNATVPLYYENRIPELQLTNVNLNEDMERLLEEAELDEAQQRKFEREFTREYHLLTRDDRLETISRDIVDHFMGRGWQGKAMVISVDKATAVRMYDKVRKYWLKSLASLKKQLKTAKDAERPVIEGRIKYMRETDMAVVVSPSQNEIDNMRSLGLDIRSHRKRMVTEDLDEKFKKPEDPLRIVFVCAMWITGFDVPCCSTMYLDKPMRNHTLMQTIARANRVFKDKNNGLIVDYVGVFRDLQKALSIYGTGDGGETPIKDKRELSAELRKSIEEMNAFCLKHEINPEAIALEKGFMATKLLDDAVEQLIINDETKKRFQASALSVRKLYKAVLPDPEAQEYSGLVIVFNVLAEKIRSLEPATDIDHVKRDVIDLLDRSIASSGYEIREKTNPFGMENYVDLSAIDFDGLKKHFEKSHKRIQAELLKGVLNAKLIRMVRLNRTRMNFMEEFQRLIDEYNTTVVSVDEFFERLLAFTRKLNEEDKRGMAEGLSEEELTLFDILTKPPIEMNKKEREIVKKVSHELLIRLNKEKLVLDWRKKQQARAAVRVCIEEQLDFLPRAYSKDIYREKCEAVYQHVYESYFGSNTSVYTQVA